MLSSLLLALALNASAVQWTISAPAPSSTVKRGAQVEVVLEAAIADGWHLYSLKKLEGGPIPTTLTLPLDQPFLLSGPISASRPAAKFDETFGMEVETYSDSATFRLPVEVPKDAPTGPALLTVNARFQACDGKQCLPPRTVKVELPVTIQP